MTDKEKLIALFNDWGVGYELEDGSEMFPGGPHVICKESKAKISGYSMFCTVFEFDETGQFIKMGAWE